jgi:hypothetical protein
VRLLRRSGLPSNVLDDCRAAIQSRGTLARRANRRNSPSPFTSFSHYTALHVLLLAAAVGFVLPEPQP